MVNNILANVLKYLSGWRLHIYYVRIAQWKINDSGPFYPK